MAHIARHEVTPEQVEEVCHGDSVVQEGKKGRSLVFGPITGGRMLMVVLDPTETPNVYYVVTARPASRRERAVYARERGGAE